MELRRLKYFVAVAEERHFGRAAARLDMAQPPLSRQVRALERELDTALVDRSLARIRLTPAGEVLLERARDLIARAQAVEREVRRLGRGSAGTLRVTFVGSATHGVLPMLIKSFRSHYPDVELALSAMNNAEQHRALVRADTDVAIARPGFDDDAIVTEPLFHEPLTLALPDDSPVRAKRPMLADLAHETSVLYPRFPRPSFADHVLGVCRHEGFEPASTVLAMDYQTAISLVSVGVGVSLVPASVAGSSHPSVSFRPYAGHNPGTGLGIGYRRDNRSVPVRNFVEIARRFARTASASGPVPDQRTRTENSSE